MRIVCLLLAFVLSGCWPNPYYLGFRGLVVDSYGLPVANAKVILESSQRCVGAEGEGKRHLSTKATSTNSVGAFSISTWGITLDSYSFFGSCRGAQADHYVCFHGQWWKVPNAQRETKIIVLDLDLASTDFAYWKLYAPYELRSECGK